MIYSKSLDDIMYPIRCLLMFLVNLKMLFCKHIKVLLALFNINRYYTDNWGAYELHLDPEKHEVGKKNTKKIERMNLNFRTWVKCLTGRTICFSKLGQMHDIVIGLLINKAEFERDIHAQSQIRPTTDKPPISRALQPTYFIAQTAS